MKRLAAILALVLVLAAVPPVAARGKPQAAVLAAASLVVSPDPAPVNSFVDVSYTDAEAGGFVHWVSPCQSGYISSGAGAATLDDYVWTGCAGTWEFSLLGAGPTYDVRATDTLEVIP